MKDLEANLEKLIQDSFESFKEKGINVGYYFNSNLRTAISFDIKSKKIVFNLDKVKDYLMKFHSNDPLKDYYISHFIDRLVAHGLIYYLNDKISEQLIKNGKENLIAKLFNYEKSKELYEEAVEEANRGNYEITKEETFYSRATRLYALENFFKVFDAFSFNFSYEKDREIFHDRDEKSLYKNYEHIDFNKLFSKDLYYKSKESYKLYKKVASLLAKGLSREIGKYLDTKLDGVEASYGLYFYSKNYREKFAEKAFYLLEKLRENGVSRRKFFYKYLLRKEDYKKDPKIFETVYETYKRVLNDVLSFFKEYKNYVKETNPFYQKIFDPYKK